MDDLISRQAVIEINRSYHGQMPNEVNHRIWKEINELPSAQPERLTDDDFETIRIHLNAYKEKLCNQHRWKEADEYQRILDRFISFASAQPVAKDINVPVKDCISRQAAIDIERNATVDTNPSHFEAHQKFTQFMDDAEVSSFGRWQWSNGFNTALTAVGIDLKKLPSAQPERKTGRWIYHDDDDMRFDTYHCSECKKLFTVDAERFDDIGFVKEDLKYCPNCGARMEGES